MDGSLPCAAGEPHPQPRDSQCHPLILDGLPSRRSAVRRQDGRKSACTFYLVFKEPRLAEHAPRQLYFLQGNLPILQKAPHAVNPLRHLFPPRPSRGNRRGIAPPKGGFASPQKRRGSCELKECRPDSAPSRFVVTAGHARSIQYTQRIPGCQPVPRSRTASASLRNRRSTTIRSRHRRVNLCDEKISDHRTRSRYARRPTSST